MLAGGSITHLLVRSVLAPLTRLLYRPDVHGAANVPTEGPLIIAANHRSEVDTAALALLTPRAVRFLGKAEYFTGTGLKRRLVASFLSALGYVPVRRDNARAGLAALESARTVLDSGGVFAIYPEGTRSTDGRLHRGHTGVGALALTTGARVVPVALRGTENVQPIGNRLPRIAKFTIEFGEPLDFSRYDGLESAPAIRRAVTDEVMYAILDLSDQAYVDAYQKRTDAEAA